MAKKALLMILDGWGIGNHTKGDVIYSTPTPYWDYRLGVEVHKRRVCQKSLLLIERDIIYYIPHCYDTNV